MKPLVSRALVVLGALLVLGVLRPMAVRTLGQAKLVLALQMHRRQTAEPVKPVGS